MLNYLVAFILVAFSLQADITPIIGGASNANFRLSAGQNDLFLRIAPPNQEDYLADIHVEYEVLHKLTPIGCSPKPLFFDPTKRLLITEFIPPAEQKVDLLDRGVRQKLIKLLHKIEVSGICISRNFLPYHHTMHLAAMVGDDYKNEFTTKFGSILQRLDTILAKNPKKTLCHLDLHSLNIIQGQSTDQLWIVDWEYAMMGHPFLVLASMASIERWNDQEMMLLLEDYMGSYSKQDFELLYLYRIVIDLFWTAWNELQSRTSSLNMPFAEWKQLFEEAAASRISKLSTLQPNIILVGPPGSGKGTFSDFAVEHGYNHLSAGDLLRDEIKKETPFGKAIEELVKQGEYVDPAILFSLIRTRILDFKSQNKPFIIDGYGRTEEDILALSQLLIEENLQDKTQIVWLNADDEVCKARIKTRLVCSVCHHVYNTRLDKATAGAACAHCKDGTLEIRLNDTESATDKRLKKYHEEIVHNYKKAEAYFPSITFDTNKDREQVLIDYEQLLSGPTFVNVENINCSADGFGF